MNNQVTQKPYNILLADDDMDDRFFFDLALKEIPFNTNLATVEDGEKLMVRLLNKTRKLPDMLFLDLNMPRKNGAECLAEIKRHPRLKNLPVIIYSTSIHEDTTELLNKSGADHFLIKCDYTELAKAISHVFTLLKGIPVKEVLNKI